LNHCFNSVWLKAEFKPNGTEIRIKAPRLDMRELVLETNKTILFYFMANGA